MTYSEFKKKIQLVLGEFGEKEKHDLWQLYLSFLPRLQYDENQTFQFIVLVYQKAPHVDMKNFSEAMYLVYDKHRFMNLNIFDVFSLDDWKEKMKLFIIGHTKEKLSSKEYQVVSSYSDLLCEEKYDLYQQTLMSNFLYFEEQLSGYWFTKNTELYGENISYCVEIYAFVRDYLEDHTISFDKNELKETIVQTYEEYENPMLYQGRLNYVLGNYFPVFDSLEEISKFLIRYFSSEEIHRCFKDIYFLAGYFNQYDIDSFTLENINDKVEEGKRYFMDDEEEDKEKTFVRNVLDYFMDELQTKKDPQFLCGLMLEGATHLNPQEEENVFQKVS